MRWKCTDTAKALCKAKSTTHSIHYATMLTKLCFSCQWRCCADSDPTVLSVTLLCCKWTYFVLSLPLMSCLWSYSAVNDPTVLSLTLLFCHWPYCSVIDLTVLSLTLLFCHWSYCAVNDPTVLSMTLLCCQWSDCAGQCTISWHRLQPDLEDVGSVGVSGACTFTFSVFCGCHGITL